MAAVVDTVATLGDRLTRFHRTTQAPLRRVAHAITFAPALTATDEAATRRDVLVDDPVAVIVDSVTLLLNGLGLGWYASERAVLEATDHPRQLASRALDHARLGIVGHLIHNAVELAGGGSPTHETTVGPDRASSPRGGIHRDEGAARAQRFGEAKIAPAHHFAVFAQRAGVGRTVPFAVIGTDGDRRVMSGRRISHTGIRAIGPTDQAPSGIHRTGETVGHRDIDERAPRRQYLCRRGQYLCRRGQYLCRRGQCPPVRQTRQSSQAHQSSQAMPR